MEALIKQLNEGDEFYFRGDWSTMPGRWQVFKITDFDGFGEEVNCKDISGDNAGIETIFFGTVTVDKKSG
jgi:hypothetical protein